MPTSEEADIDIDELKARMAQHMLPPEARVAGSVKEHGATTTSLIDLLTASAHDPSHLEDDDGDHDDTSESDLASGDATPPLTPPTSEEGSLEWQQQRQLATELATDVFDTEDAAILRAQKTDEPESFAEETELSADEAQEVLDRISHEFGSWPDASERVLCRIPAALARSVYVRGTLALTNRRLIFLAYIPHYDAHQLIRAGPITYHPAASFSPPRRHWCELRADSISWYKSSAKTYKPLGACRISQIRRLLPINQDSPKMIHLELIDGRMVDVELDLPESARAWQEDIEKALFTFQTTADKLRLAIPLDHILDTDVMSISSLIDHYLVHFVQDHGDEDDYVTFCWLKSRSSMAGLVQEAVDEAKRQEPTQYRAILELDGPLRTAESEARHSETPPAAGSLQQRICRQFALGDRPEDLYVVKDVELVRHMPTWGVLAVSKLFVLFWKKAIVGNDVQLRLPIQDLDDIVPCRAFGFHIYGLALRIHGAPDIRLDFHSVAKRDGVIDYLKDRIKLAQKAKSAIQTATTPTGDPLAPTASRSPESSTPSSPSLQASLDGQILPFDTHAPARPSLHVDTWVSEPRFTIGTGEGDHDSVPGDVQQRDAFFAQRPTVLNLSSPILTNVHFVCLTIGSRGDVQPYIALGLELKKWGNRVTIASHPEYRDWVESYDIEYKEVGGDPAALMKLSVEHKMFSPGFFKESLGHFRQWLDDLFHESWEACQEADVLIESPSTMAGIHVAEALRIPYFRAFTMPWTSTATYPHAFAASLDLGPTYNLLSYSMFDSIMWKATAGQVNRWRKKELGLRATTEKKMAQTTTPFIYNFSEAIVPRPNDWKDNIYISGYWFLEDNKPFNPPEGLLDFIDKAHQEEKAVVYIGFGSITVPDSAAVTKAVVQAVKNADVRAILSKGWSERGAKTPAMEVPLPPEIFSVASIDHGHLFPLIDAAMHHGGAGTTAASLKAGLPTLICPFFGDQLFWASRIQKLGAGLRVNSLTENALTNALKKGTTDRIIKEKAQAVGEKLRAEKGCANAVQFLSEHVSFAAKQTRDRAARSEKRTDPANPSSRGSTPTGLRRLKSPLRASTLPTWLTSGSGSSSPRSSLDGKTEAAESEEARGRSITINSV